MKTYKTGQRRLLLDFFAAHPGEVFSVDGILAALPAEAQVSRSAVYRNVDRMAREGLLRRTLSADGAKALYQAVDCGESCERLHLQCEKCGRVFHMEDAQEEARLRDALDRSGFRLDEHASLLSGTCRDCGGREASK